MKFSKSESTVPDVDMTPMIDIVFQLIAFFMVINNFEQTQADERVKLPKEGHIQVAKTKKDRELVLNFGYVRNADGSRKGTGDPLLFYNGESFLLGNFKPQLQFEAGNYRDLGVAIKEVTVVIRADAEVPTGQVQELIKLCQESGIGFEKFSLRAEQEEKT